MFEKDLFQPEELKGGTGRSLTVSESVNALRQEERELPAKLVKVFVY